MTDTPIIDAAIRAGCNAVFNKPCEYPACSNCDTKLTTLAALRAALPWDLPAERLEAMARARHDGTHEHAKWGDYSDVWHKDDMTRTLIAYRADPIMRELYPERF